MTTHGHIPWTRPLAAAITLIAGALVALSPALASAGPVPDPTPRHVATTAPALCGRDAALAYFIAAYRTAPLWDKRRIHNEITGILADPEITCR